MAKYRGMVVEVEDMAEFNTEAEARAWAMARRDEFVKAHPAREFYFEVDDCGSEDEAE